jgi:steroid 5-alpha reductase family enzyme
MDWNAFLFSFEANVIVIFMMMFIFWMLYFGIRKEPVIDIGWAFTLLAAVISTFGAGDGYFLRKAIFFVLATVWSLRLGSYLLVRFLRNPEDSRYKSIREQYRGQMLIRMSFFFLLQACILSVLIWPFILITCNASPSISGLEWFAVLFTAVFILGEAISDHQMFRFKSDPQNQHKVLQQGLWKYSRHPNYFCEWMVWVGFALFALDAPLGITGVISPIIMFYVLTRWTGVTPSEKAALTDRGEEYKKYCEGTSAFFPKFW